MPHGAVLAFRSLLDRVVSQGNQRSMLEDFKGHFGGSARSWAESDLNNLLWHAAEDASLLIELFYEGAKHCAVAISSSCRMSEG